MKSVIVFSAPPDIIKW